MEAVGPLQKEGICIFNNAVVSYPTRCLLQQNSSVFFCHLFEVFQQANVIFTREDMASTNLTEAEKLEPVIEPFCTRKVKWNQKEEVIFLSAVNVLVSVTAFLGNTLILVALHKQTSLHPPSKLLYRNLAITDLCVGIIAEPLNVASSMSVLNDICVYMEQISFITSGIFCSISLLTVTAISVDRLLALLLGLRYRHVVTFRRTLAFLIAFWVYSLVATLSSFGNPVIHTVFIYLTLTLCLCTLFFSYTKIFFTLRHNQVQVQDHLSQGQPNQIMNMTRYKRAVSNALWVTVTSVVCYLPFVIMEAVTRETDVTLSIFLTRQFVVTLVFLNSSLNPLLYCWKIREVRQAVKDSVRQLFCSPN